MSKSLPHYPLASLKLLRIAGKMISVSRKEHQWRQIDLANRLGVTRQTVARLERGDPSIAAGTYFAGAWLLDLPFIQLSEQTDEESKSILNNLLLLLESKSPKRITKSRKPIDDNF